MSTVTRKVDRLYDVRGTLKIMASPFVAVGRVYVQGAYNLIHGTRRLIGREPRVVVKVTVPRQRRNYSQAAITRARALFPREFVRVLTSIGLDGQDAFLGYLRALPVAIASQSFNEIFDQAMADERLSEQERQGLSAEALSMIARDFELDGLLHVHADSPTTPEAGAESPAAEPERQSPVFFTGVDQPLINEEEG